MNIYRTPVIYPDSRGRKLDSVAFRITIGETTGQHAKPYSGRSQVQNCSVRESEHRVRVHTQRVRVHTKTLRVYTQTAHTRTELSVHM